MTLYAVFQEGVYRHGCVGIFDDLDAARKAADDAAENMGDDGYHEYCVVPFGLNRSYAVKAKNGRPFDIVEADKVYEAKLK